MPSANRSVPCHVIAGALGVGKTSAIISCLQSLGEFSTTLVIVNDFGQTGLDAEIFRDTSGRLEISNIKGGCLCCSSMQEMSDVIQAVFESPKIKRIIIEPSGLAVLPDLVPFLEKLTEKYPLDLRPIITLIHLKKTQQRHYKGAPFLKSLVDCADILVGNRADQASEAEIQHFREWTSQLQPAKLQVIETSFGRLPEEVFELQRGLDDDLESEHAHQHHDHDHKHDHTHDHEHHETSGGFVDESIMPVSEEKFRTCLEQWSREGTSDAEFLRFKALLPTDQGWRLFEIAAGDCYVRPMSEGSVGKLDWISKGNVSTATIRAALVDCRV